MINFCKCILGAVAPLLILPVTSEAKLWADLLPNETITIDGNSGDWDSVKAVTFQDRTAAPKTIKYATDGDFLYWAVYSDQQITLSDSNPFTFTFRGENPNIENYDWAISSFSFTNLMTLDYFELVGNNNREIKFFDGPESGIDLTGISNIKLQMNGSKTFMEGKLLFSGDTFEIADYISIASGYYTAGEWQLDSENGGDGLGAISELTPTITAYTINNPNEWGAMIETWWSDNFFDLDAVGTVDEDGRTLPANLDLKITTPENYYIDYNIDTDFWDIYDQGQDFFYLNTLNTPVTGVYDVDAQLYNSSQRTLNTGSHVSINTLRQLPIIDMNSLEIDDTDPTAVSLSCDPVSYTENGQDVPLYYRFKVYKPKSDGSGYSTLTKSSSWPYLTTPNWVFSTQEDNGTSYDISELKFKLEVYDGKSWDNIQNKSNTFSFMLKDIKKANNLAPINLLLLN